MSKIAFIGLGAMGYGMALCLSKSGHDVVGYDLNPVVRGCFEKEGGRSASSARQAIEGSAIVILMVVSETQIESILFGKDATTSYLQPGCSLVICATVSPSYPQDLQQKLEPFGVRVVDCPVSGGVAKAADGTLKIFVSQVDEIATGTLLREALFTMADKLEVVSGGLGAGTKLKLINQQLAGIHIAAATEISALAISLGLNLRGFYHSVVSSEASSWMFENRVPHILECDWTPKSALDIFVKDMGIVTTAASTMSMSVPLAAVSQQLYILGSLSGYGREDDSGLVRVFLGPRDIARPATDGQNNDEAKSRMLMSALLGVHLMAAVEAFALAERLGLDTALMYSAINGAAGSSKAFEKYGFNDNHLETGLVDLKTISFGLEQTVLAGNSLKTPAFLSTIALQTLRSIKGSNMDQSNATKSCDQEPFLSRI